ncbi:MAG: EFR1 family ferrodoxin [Elusimicrobiales bacterium]|jgi:ferredoxin
MSTTIYYYTGTGNSLWAARKLAAELPDTRLASMRRARPEDGKSKTAGLVFPVHIWGLPRRVVEFLSRLPADPSVYYFAVAVNAGQTAATLPQLQKLMKARGLNLSSGFSLVMPSNYIPWGGAAPAEEQDRQFSAADKKLKEIADLIGRRETKPVEKGPLWQRLLLSGVCYKLSYSKVPKTDKDFWVDDKCNSCAVCTAVCPSGNILLNSGKPVWQGKCELCLACIQWCPLEAIQFGKKTPGYTRYHHPEITLSDMLG